MKKKLTLIVFILMFYLNIVNGQTYYNKYTKFNPYYGDSQTYNQKNSDGEDRRFELGVIVMGVGLVTMLAATYSYTSYQQNYYSYGYKRETSYPVFFTGLALTGTGLVIALRNSGKKRGQ